MSERLTAQIAFILEIDRLKSILRQTWISDMSRRENSAEHSWQLALMAMTLSEHANEPVDVNRVVRMVLLHDIVEIDAGDAFLYDDAAQAMKAEREKAAADRIFGLLPEDLCGEFRATWEEFEAGESAEARFAQSLDRLMPMMLNYVTEGRAWQANGVTADRVLKRCKVIDEGSHALWAHAQEVVAAAVRDGYLLPARD
jgi:putative hydrolase of HD superfamily